MRAVIWDWAWDDDYDDLRSFEPEAKAVRRLLPEPPLPPSAEWREGAEATEASPAHGRARRAAGILLFAAQCAAAALLLVWLTQTGRFGNPLGLVWTAGMIAAFGLGSVAIWRSSMTVSASPDVRKIAREIPRFDVFPVRVRIVQDRKLTGIDHGVAWFTKDALHFKGLESEFIVGAQDLRYDPIALGDGRGALERGWVMPTLALRHPDRALSVVFQPMDRMDRHDKRDCGYRFRHHLRLFLRHWRPSRVGSLYPPQARQPSMPVQRGSVGAEVPADAPAATDG